MPPTSSSRAWQQRPLAPAIPGQVEFLAKLRAVLRVLVVEDLWSQAGSISGLFGARLAPSIWSLCGKRGDFNASNLLKFVMATLVKNKIKRDFHSLSAKVSFDDLFVSVLFDTTTSSVI